MPTSILTSQLGTCQPAGNVIITYIVYKIMGYLCITPWGLLRVVTTYVLMYMFLDLIIMKWSYWDVQ